MYVFMGFSPWCEGIAGYNSGNSSNYHARNIYYVWKFAMRSVKYAYLTFRLFCTNVIDRRFSGTGELVFKISESSIITLNVKHRCHKIKTIKFSLWHTRYLRLLRCKFNHSFVCLRNTLFLRISGIVFVATFLSSKWKKLMN